MALIDGCCENSIRDSVADFFGVSCEVVDQCVESFRPRVRNVDISWYYDGIEIEEILDYMSNRVNKNLIPYHERIEGICVFHLASIIDETSFWETGILNLRGLFEQENSLKGFLRLYGVELLSTDTGLLVTFRGRPVQQAMVSRRQSWDHCVNGFLLRDSIEENINVDHLLRCPEIVQSIADGIRNDMLIHDWNNRAVPSVIKFTVGIDNIGHDTFDRELTPDEKALFFIHKSIEYLLQKRTGYWSSSQNPMIFVHDQLCVPSQNLLAIDPAIF